MYILLYMIQYKYHKVFFSFFYDLVIANTNLPTTNEPFVQVKENNACMSSTHFECKMGCQSFASISKLIG